MEGGGRVNYGSEYTMQFNQGGAINMLFGQSYQLFGENSFAMGGITNTGPDSGLEDVAALDKLTAPMPLYPAWFSAKTLDAPQSSALGSCSGN